MTARGAHHHADSPVARCAVFDCSLFCDYGVLAALVFTVWVRTHYREPPPDRRNIVVKEARWSSVGTSSTGGCAGSRAGRLSRDRPSGSCWQQQSRLARLISIFPVVTDAGFAGHEAHSIAQRDDRIHRRGAARRQVRRGQCDVPSTTGRLQTSADRRRSSRTASSSTAASPSRRRWHRRQDPSPPASFLQDGETEHSAAVRPAPGGRRSRGAAATPRTPVHRRDRWLPAGGLRRRNPRSRPR